MSYALLILRRAQKELSNLDKNEYEQTLEAVLRLAENPRPNNCKKLVGGRDGWRIRSGNYRIIYEIDDTKREVIVLHIGHRRDVYSESCFARFYETPDEHSKLNEAKSILFVERRQRFVSRLEPRR